MLPRLAHALCQVFLARAADLEPAAPHTIGKVRPREHVYSLRECEQRVRVAPVRDPSDGAEHIEHNVVG